MKKYHISNLRLIKNGSDVGTGTDGYNVHDYFKTAGDIRRFGFYSPEAALNFAAQSYNGDDEHGIGVSWEVEEVEEGD